MSKAQIKHRLSKTENTNDPVYAFTIWAFGFVWVLCTLGLGFLPQVAAAALVNINTATLEELDQLPGVGPTIAERIIAARPFSSTSDIQNVQGIGGPGSKTYEDIIGLITVGTGEDNGTNDSSEGYKSSSTTASNSSVKEPRIPVDGLIIYAPEIGYVNQSIKFDAEPTDGTDGRLIRYKWNFGDALTAATKSPEHSYSYPGTYVVMVESYYDKKEITARHEINVLSAALSLSRHLNGDVTVKNENPHEIDLGGMKLIGQSVFEFPEYTILMPGKLLVIPDDELDATANNAVTLHDEFGKVMASTYKPQPYVPAKLALTSFTPNSSQSLPIVNDLETSTTSIDANESVNEAAETGTGLNSQSAATGEAGRLPEGSLPYLGLIGVISIGLLAIYGSKFT